MGFGSMVFGAGLAGFFGSTIGEFSSAEYTFNLPPFRQPVHSRLLVSLQNPNQPAFQPVGRVAVWLIEGTVVAPLSSQRPSQMGVNSPCVESAVGKSHLRCTVLLRRQSVC